MELKGNKAYAKRVLIGGIGAVMALSFTASANLVVDGGFEMGAVSGGYQTYSAVSTMGGWTVSAGSVDLIGSYWVGDPGQSVDMAGLWQNGTIWQTILNTIPGAWYHLTFDMSGNPDNNHQPQPKEVLVAFGNTTQTFSFSSTVNTHQNMGWQPRAGDFQANSTSTLLQFTDVSGGVESGTAFGAAIDNVVLVPVPEPATTIAGALLLLPFGASAVRILRKNQKA